MSDITREEFDELRNKVTELITAQNENVNWMRSFRMQLDTLTDHAIVRWFLWVRPIPIPEYPRRIIRHFARHDRKPVARRYDDVSPNVRTAIIVERPQPFPLAIDSGKDG